MRGTWRRGFFTGDPEDYVEKGSGISFHRGPAGEPAKGLIYRGLWNVNEGGLCKQNIYVCGSSMRGTWREGSFTGDPESYAK